MDNTVTDRTLKKAHAFGFTLFEILISIFIFSVIVTTIFGSYRAVFSSTEAINTGMAAFEMIGGGLDRMSIDIASASVTSYPGYQPPEMNHPPDPHRIVGDQGPFADSRFGRLRLASFAHLPMGKDQTGGIAQIIYYVQPIDEDRYVLKRADHLPPFPDPDEPGNDPILIENLKSLTFTYYDHEGNEYDTWDSESRENNFATPTAVKIQVETGDDSISYFFETMVKFPVVRVPRG
jgi:general secretion pathway protein J